MILLITLKEDAIKYIKVATKHSLSHFFGSRPVQTNIYHHRLCQRFYGETAHNNTTLAPRMWSSLREAFKSLFISSSRRAWDTDCSNSSGFSPGGLTILLTDSISTTIKQTSNSYYIFMIYMINSKSVPTYVKLQDFTLTQPNRSTPQLNQSTDTC